MTTNNLLMLSDKCTICRHDCEDPDTLDPRVCLCKYVGTKYGEQCAVAGFRATDKKVKLAEAAGLISIPIERVVRPPRVTENEINELNHMWHQKCLHCGSYVSECQCSGGYGN